MGGSVGVFPNGSRFGLFKLIGGVGNPALDDHFDAFGVVVIIVIIAPNWVPDGSGCPQYSAILSSSLFADGTQGGLAGRGAGRALRATQRFRGCHVAPSALNKAPF